MACPTIDGLTPSTGPELDQQLGRRGGVVGDVVDAVATGRHDGGDAGMALRSHSLRQRLVDDLPHDVAAELPALAVELDQSGARQVVEVGDAEVLTHLLGEPRQRRDVLVVPEHGGVVEDRPLHGRQLVDAGGDEGPQRARQLRRVGAARRRAPPARPGTAGCRRRDRRAPRRRRSSSPGSRLASMLRTRSRQSARSSGPSGTCTTSGRSTVGGHSTSGSGRCPVMSRNGHVARATAR